MTAAFLVIAAASLVATTDGVTAPLDVSAVSRGAAAAAFDVAAAGVVDGPEVHLRLLGERQGAPNRAGVYGVLPVGPLSLALGHDWVSAPGARHRRLTAGLALHLGDCVTGGAAYRLYGARAGELDGMGRWDLGVVAEPTSWLAISAAADALNRPPTRGREVAPSYRFGLGVRPIAGATWLTLASEMTVRRAAPRVAVPTLLVDLAPYDGAHARVAYTPRDGRLWLGLELGFGGASLVGGAAAPRFGDRPSARAAQLYAVTTRATQRDSFVAEQGRIVELELSGDLTESSGGVLAARSSIATAAYRLAELARDPSVAQVILPIGELDVGLAEVDDLRAAIFALRRAGKQVVAEIGNADEKAFLIAAAADRIRMDTAASLTLDGFAVRELYLADTLASVGVRFDAVAMGRFKTAPDALTRSTPRPEDETVQRALLGEAMATLRHALVHDRALAASDVERVLATGLFTASEAQRAHLVDELTQPTDPNAAPRVRERGGSATVQARRAHRWGAPAVIAVVPVVGTIAMQSGDNPLPGPTVTAAELVGALEDALTDSAVRAVVLRIDSPGGDVTAADVIWRAVRRLQQTKPVVVSMGDVAASGGYYIAAPADVVIAQPNTITGSIGVFALHLDLSDLLVRTRVHARVYATNPEADWQMSHHALSDEGRRRLAHNLELYYDDFLAKVAAGRRLPLARVREVAEGHVYTGAQALELGLVDAIGSMADAIAEAKMRAGLLDSDEVEVRIPEQALDLGALATQLTLVAQGGMGPWTQLAERWVAWEARPLALLPTRFEVGR